MSKDKVFDFFKRNFLVILFILAIIFFFVYTFTKEGMKRLTTYTVVEGIIEIGDQTTMYLAKNETIIDYDKSTPITALVEQGKKASKNESVATYQNESYGEYLKQIEDIDSQIQTLVKDLPATYSSDLTNVEAKILTYAKEIQHATSYSKIQEYKTKMDELAYKKITILANSSPDSSAIRDLLNQREELVRLSKSSNNTISTPVSGIVTYKLDGLEDKIDFTNLRNFSSADINSLIGSYSGSSNNEFGIKVIDNFNVYLIAKTPVGDSSDYIAEGRNYKIRIADIENQVVTVTLVKNIQEGGYNYSIFKMNNDVDNVVDFRAMSCEIIWKSYSGLAVPLTSISRNEEKGYDYVRMVFGTKYVEVPINIVRKSDSIAIVSNFTKEQYQEFGLEKECTVELYDELVIE